MQIRIACTHDYLYTYLSSAVDLASSDLGGEVSDSSLSGSITDPSMGMALEHSTEGIPFRVFIRTLENLSFDGKIPSISIKRKQSLPISNVLFRSRLTISKVL